jgi:hypothetical protein
MSGRKRATVLCGGLSLALAFSVVAPQLAAQPVAAANGPIMCFDYADDQVRLSQQLALDLCLGAPSDAPARCAESVIGALDIADAQAVQLCRGASSTVPAQCADRLDDLDYTDLQIVQFCQAQPYPLVPTPGGGSPECVAAADAQTTLSGSDIVRLCAGSTSTAPVVCYETGDDATTLADRELITLCASTVTSPYGQPLY